jgi:FkbM family methyltransferase
MKQKFRQFFRNLRNAPSKWRFFASKFLLHTRLGPLVVMRRNGYRLRLYPTNLSHAFFLGDRNFQRRADEAFIERIVKSGDFVVDIGANIGSFALQCAHRVGPMGRVIAVEAHPRIFRYLCGNIRLNRCGKVVKAFHCGMGDVAGEMRITDSRYDDTNHLTDGGDGLAVPIRTLDDLLADQPGTIDLLKIDVEGYERFVLRGGSGTLRRVRILYIEVCEVNFKIFGYTVAELLSELEEAGYTLTLEDEDGHEQPVPAPLVLHDSHRNLIARRPITDDAAATF